MKWLSAMLAFALVVVEVHGQGATQGGSGSPPAPGSPPPGIGTGGGGMIGWYGGCCVPGSFSGCIGGFGCCGGFTGMGCTPYYPYGLHSIMPVQAYSRWHASPNKSYYYRLLSVRSLQPPGKDLNIEYAMTYYPDRPKFFYFYDPAERQFVGRYRLGVSEKMCFEVLAPAERKRMLRDIPERGFRSVSGMPSLAVLLQKRAATVADAPTLQNLKLTRPPESLPDELGGLPPEEESSKKK